jgi:hypothetical protein
LAGEEIKNSIFQISLGAVVKERKGEEQFKVNSFICRLVECRREEQATTTTT